MKKIMGFLVMAGVLCAGMVMSGAVMAQEQVQAAAVDVGNKKCPVMGGESSASITVEYKGKSYRLCCPGCKAAFNADPEKYSKIADDEVAAEKAE